MSEKLTDELRAKLAPGFIDMPGSETPDSRKECAYIGLRGATERLMLVLQYRSERNYDVAVAAVVQAHAEYLRTIAGTNGESK